MGNNQNWINTGEQIKNALADALNTGDFKELNNVVAQSVTTALNEAGIHVNNTIGGNRNNSGNFSQSSSGSFSQSNAGSFSQSSSQSFGGFSQSSAGSFSSSGNGVQININGVTAGLPIWQQRAQERARKRQDRLNHMEAARSGNTSILQNNASAQNELINTTQNNIVAPPGVKMRRIGQVSNVLYQVFGGIGLGITGFVTLIRLFVFLDGDTTLGGWIVNFAFLALFYGMIKLGLGQKQRLKRALRYVQLCGRKMYEDIETLAKSIGKSTRFVGKDLSKMLELGFFPEGHIDEKSTCLMLNDNVYRQYLETETNFKRIGMEETKEEIFSSDESQEEMLNEQASELDAIIAEGMEYIRKLRNLNDRIAGEAISSKLFRLENLLKELFDCLKEHPEQIHRMHKLMEYYLPTTLKLVETYENFDRISSPGEEIVNAKAEIENTLDTINEAFSELLNNLFQDTVFDITTDAQVLKSMLAREGLTRDMELVPNDREPQDSKPPRYMN